SLLQRLLNSIPGFVSILDTNLTYIYVNNSLQEILGRQVIGTQMERTVPDSDLIRKTVAFAASDLLKSMEEVDLRVKGANLPERYVAHWHRTGVGGDIVIVCLNVEELHQKRIELEKQKVLYRSL